jgi:hypothetical protein
MRTDDKKIKDLEKKIKKLGKVIETQRKLIEVLKTLPGNKGVKLRDEKRGKKKNGVSKRVQGKGGNVAINSAPREPEDHIRSFASNDENIKVMEETKPPES